MANRNERLAKLEKASEEPIDVLHVQQGQDIRAAIKQRREETGRLGPIVALDELDQKS